MELAHGLPGFCHRDSTCKTPETLKDDRLGRTHLDVLLAPTSVATAGRGGQPGDGDFPAVATAVHESDRSAIVHVPADGGDLPDPGTAVTCKLDWQKRLSHMRVHSALHLLCAALPYPVTGGSVGADKGRLDFDIPEATLDKEQITQELNRLIGEDHPVAPRWITDDELLAQPDLVKTMSVKPPMGAGKVRLIEVAGLDLQPCGGTHVARTGEIAPVFIRKIEKKGRQNRRVVIAFSD